MNESKNIALVKSIYAAFGAGTGDNLKVLDLVTEDIDWMLVGKRDDVPYAGQFTGHEGVREFYRIVIENTEVIEFVQEEFMEYEDKVIVLGHEHVKAKATGRSWKSPWIHVFWIRDGLCCKLREWYDTAEMMKAFEGE
jgi:ketosteroid isomerase-like protein